MLKNLSVRSQLLGLSVAVVVLLVAFALVVWLAVGSISTAADRMGVGKDLVADILPPPLYILEADLTVFQLQDAAGPVIPALIEKLKSLKKDYDERNAFWEKASLDPALRKALLGEQREAGDRFWKLILGDYLTAIQKGDKDRVAELVAEAQKVYRAHRNGVDASVKVASQYADDTLSSLQATSTKVRAIVLLLACGGALLASLAIALVMREILRRLGGEPHEMQIAARRMSEGDLTVQLAAASGNKDSLLTSIMHMQANLRNIITQTRQAAEQVTNAARHLADNSEQVSKSSSQQSEAAASMAASVEQVTVSISHVADNATSARTLAQETGRLTDEGQTLVQDTIAEINKISDSVERSSNVIKMLGDQSNQISSIANVIKEIADQTNLLALNAAIEAARAGEQGRGFAVVADEVRKLAERTAQSTKEITTMIDAIQSGTLSAVAAMEDGRNQVGAGVNLADKTGASVTRIQDGTQQVLVAVEEISNALAEQTTASTQIAKDVETIAQMTEENSVAITAVSESASQLEQLAVGLKKSVDQFKV